MQHRQFLIQDLILQFVLLFGVVQLFLDLLQLRLTAACIASARQRRGRCAQFLRQFVQFVLQFQVIIQALLPLLDRIGHIGQGESQAFRRIDNGLRRDLVQETCLFGDMLGSLFPIVDQLRDVNRWWRGRGLLLIVVREKSAAREIMQEFQLTASEVIQGLILLD